MVLCSRFRFFALTALLLLSCISGDCIAQSPVSRVKANMGEQEAAWNRGDLNAFMEYYWNDDSLKFIGSRGVTYGWRKTLDNYKKSYPSKEAMGTLTFTLIEITALSKSNVFVIGRWHLEKEKPAGGHFTLLWKKIDGRWVIVADHTS